MSSLSLPFTLWISIRDKREKKETRVNGVKKWGTQEERAREDQKKRTCLHAHISYHHLFTSQYTKMCAWPYADQRMMIKPNQRLNSSCLKWMNAKVSQRVTEKHKDRRQRRQWASLVEKGHIRRGVFRKHCRVWWRQVSQVRGAWWEVIGREVKLADESRNAQKQQIWQDHK